MFFGFSITVSPFHVVTLKSAVRISYVYSKYQVVSVIKEVIRLDVIF